MQYGSTGSKRDRPGWDSSIVKEIVEAHGGRIFVESANSHGSRFIVEIPAAKELYGQAADCR